VGQGWDRARETTIRGRREQRPQRLPGGLVADLEPTPTGRRPRSRNGNCTLFAGADQSHLELYLAALDNPVRLRLSGSVGVDCTVPENANS
jgi:hypothetical protein